MSIARACFQTGFVGLSTFYHVWSTLCVFHEHLDALFFDLQICFGTRMTYRRARRVNLIPFVVIFGLPKTLQLDYGFPYESCGLETCH